jgi:hypothetical protein
MKHTIEAQFDELKRKNPYLGDVILFNRAIRGKNFPQSTLYKFFNKLVSKDEYAADEKDEVFMDCLRITKEGSVS